MNDYTTILRATVWEDQDCVLMARVQRANNVNITQSDISSIAVKVFDLDDESQVSSTIALSVSDVVFNSLQTDSRWTKDSTGYNFRATVPAAYLPTGGKDYRVEVIFTPISGSVFHFVTELSVKNILST